MTRDEIRKRIADTLEYYIHEDAGGKNELLFKELFEEIPARDAESEMLSVIEAIHAWAKVAP